MLQNLRRGKEAIVTEVRSRIMEEARPRGPDRLLEIVNDTLYAERERLRKYSSLYKDPGKDRAFYRKLGRRLGKLSDRELAEALDRLVQHYLEEIVGKFNPLMYRLATAVVPGGLTFMLNTMSPFRILKNFPEIPSIDRSVIIDGALGKLRKLKEAGGVLVHVPVHQSNLDSPVLGYAVYRAGLPPVMYGAGLNLFQMPLFPLFMSRLGAYTVDRLKTAPLYKRILKEFATVTLEYGYDHLFFPGGTRSRSGGIERKLKKGLLGSALKAYVSCRRRNLDRRFYIVPVTVSYHVVLEAATLIEDHLMETGRSRYIIIDDESSKPAVIFDFMRRLFSLEGKVYLRFCDPLDPFGNAVDDEGNSVDGKGRIIDIDGYIRRGGDIVHDDQRDQVYTNELEERIMSTYLKETVILTTHVAAYALMTALLGKSSQGDLFKFMREEAYSASLPLEEAQAAVERLVGKLALLEEKGGLRLEPALKARRPQDIIMNAVKYFEIFHKEPVILRKGNRLFTADPSLLYYYHNRLASYGTEALQ